MNTNKNSICVYLCAFICVHLWKGFFWNTNKVNPGCPPQAGKPAGRVEVENQGNFNKLQDDLKTNAMENLSEKMREARVLLDELFGQIKAVIDGSLPAGKKQQLKALEKAFGHYSRLRLPVPREFKDIKKRFQQELDQMTLVRKEYPEFFNFLEEKLKEVSLDALYEKKEISGADVLYQASLSSDFMPLMIKTGSIQPGAILEPRYKYRKHKARVLENGKMEIKMDDIIKQFDDVHSAAAYVTGKEENGLEFWRTRNAIDKSLVKLSIFLR